MTWRAVFVAGVSAVLLWIASIAGAVTCEDVTFDGDRYTLCTVDPTSEDLRLFLRNADGQPFGTFQAVQKALPDSETLSFAMNAGMYHPDRRPVGLYIEGAHREGRLLTGASIGNFGMLPNGVFCIQPGRSDVFETLAFAAMAPPCRYASQSGPMLVIDGHLHPRFLPDSTSKRRRNGVGTSADGDRVVFAISQTAVTFHAYGRLFRDHLDLPSALYFDGRISRLHAPDIGRSDAGFPMGPIVGVVE